MPSCTICLEGELVSIRSVKAINIEEEYTLYQCVNCKSRSFDVSEHPDIDLQCYYNSLSNEKDYLKRNFVIQRYWLNEVTVIKNICGNMPNSVLDIGCRTGDFLSHWQRDIKRVGIELSVHSAAVAMERGLDVRQDFLENVEFATKFDVVSAYAILEHLANPQKFLGRVANLVNDKGILVIMIPSYQTFKAQVLDMLNIQWHMYSPPGHLSLYSREFLDSYLEARGFTLAKRRYTSGGMFNPFKRIPLARSVFSRAMWLLDAHSPLNHFPIFDHMYSYYVYSG